MPDNAQRFATLAVIDIETTNLPSHKYNRVGITELCIYAFDSSILTNKSSNIKCCNADAKRLPELPRVVQKINMLFRPSMMVDPGAEQVTGLSNDLLERESPFNDNAAQTILAFLKHLTAPICLIAHNGWMFDFPIIKQMFEDRDVVLPDDIWCVDSLRAFLEIDDKLKEELQKLPVIVIEDSDESNEKTIEESVEKLNKQSDEKDNELCDESVEKHNEDSGDSVEKSNKSDEKSNDQSDESDEKSDEDSGEKLNEQSDESDEKTSDSDNQPENEHQTKIKSDQNFIEPKSNLDWQKINETTPKRPTLPSSVAALKRRQLAFVDNGDSMPSPKRTLHSRRQLYTGLKSAETKRFPPKGVYKLANLYSSVFKQASLDAHRAEADVDMLMRLVQHYDIDFLAFAEEQAIPFRNIKSIRTKNRVI